MTLIHFMARKKNEWELHLWVSAFETVKQKGKQNTEKYM